MGNAEFRETEEKVVLTGILAEFRDALEEEINKIKKSGQSSTLLMNGRQIESKGEEFWYLFKVDYAPAMPADTPCKLVVGSEQFDVTVVSFDESTIVISSKRVLPESLGSVRLENGATVLMELLIKCIEENAQTENLVGKRMFLDGDDVYAFRKIHNYKDLAIKESFTESQNAAVQSALTNDITYIWGPPGTGKTTVIGQIIDELYKRNRTVLVVSHTNTAVDGAIEKAHENYCSTHVDDGEAWPILRIGIPAKKSLPDQVLLPSHVEKLGRELFEQKKNLEIELEENRKRINACIFSIAKCKWLAESNLKKIEVILRDIAEHLTACDESQKKIDKINAAINKIKEKYPEYTKFVGTAEDVKRKQFAYGFICEQIEKAQKAIEEFPVRIQLAQEEIKKHNLYKELKEKEAKFISENFLKNVIAKVEATIDSLSKEISNLTATQATAQRTISDYESKSTVAKLFSGKSNIIQAQVTLEKSNARMAEAMQEQQRQQNLKQEYAEQLEGLLILKEQIKLVSPEKTQEFWEAELERLQSEVCDAKEDLPSYYLQKQALHEELEILECQQNVLRKPCEEITENEKKLKIEQEWLDETKRVLVQERKRCGELLEKECALCAGFSFFPAYTPTVEGSQCLFDKLYEVYVMVEKEVKPSEVAEFEKNKQDLQKQHEGILDKIEELEKKIQNLEWQAIMDAKIVGSTLAKSYLSEALRSRKFDTVILDEASMASIPALWCASYLAETSVIIVGDFLQLPPIVMADTLMAKKWLGQDVFYHSGMQERAKNKETCPGNFVMLNDQFRMESDIAEIANMYYGSYGGLRSHDNTERREKARKEFYKWYSGKKMSQSIHLVDTESLHAWVTGVPQGKSHSRLNCFSAVVDVDLAFKFIENKLNELDPETAKPTDETLVLIVAPYKPHVNRINQLLELEYLNRGFKENLNYIRAGTIHSFQGSEADIVIFDLVIDEPHFKAAMFIEDKKYKNLDGEEINANLRKLFNVAVTRAKFKLYIVGNFAYCQKRAKNNALAQWLDRVFSINKLPKIDAKSVLPNIKFARPTGFSFDESRIEKHIVCREDTFNEHFLADIQSFKKRLIIYSPFMTEARLSVLLPYFVDAINCGKQIVVVTKALSDRGRTEISQYQKCEKELRDIGVSILHKKGMHEKLIIIDYDAVWIGSLNALSFTGLTGEVMQRHDDQKLTKEYEKIYNIEHLCDVVHSTCERNCPICGEEMLVQESDEGGVFWKCINGDYSRSANQPYPVDGIMRCKCGAPYLFAMKNEPRWICSENPKHYQKMREQDLKLEKMAELIPTKKARKEVDRYFASKKKEQEKKN